MCVCVCVCVCVCCVCVGMNVDYQVFMHECEMDSPIIVTTPNDKLLLGKGVDARIPLEVCQRRY